MCCDPVPRRAFARLCVPAVYPPYLALGTRLFRVLYTIPSEKRGGLEQTQTPSQHTPPAHSMLRERFAHPNLASKTAQACGKYTIGSSIYMSARDDNARQV